ncbi:hypothetical protein E1301_Tti012022 [Triplophysa tibetana]|uniref:Uncharacterized protein n=1 Tax=Triplophysa tibetana TaxID=1572043 RepID=A0A5A9PJH0_9TELE|nr:hypothetical protein E1301_Tti012022 [Triplophysa tibetana]
MERTRGLGDGLLKEEKKKWRRGGDLIDSLRSERDSSSQQILDYNQQIALAVSNTRQHNALETEEERDLKD